MVIHQEFNLSKTAYLEYKKYIWEYDDGKKAIVFEELNLHEYKEIPNSGIFAWDITNRWSDFEVLKKTPLYELSCLYDTDKAEEDYKELEVLMDDLMEECLKYVDKYDPKKEGK